MKILMTGGGRSTGKAVSDFLTSENNEVVTVGRSNCDHECDLFQIDNRHQAISALERWHGDECDVLVNLAGITYLEEVHKYPSVAWDRVIHLNLTVPWLLSQAFVHKRSRGRIINIASMGYRIPLRHSAAYCASKAGLVGLTKQMAKELAPHFEVYAVAPGSIQDSDMIKQVIDSMISLRKMSEEDATEYVQKGTPMGRMQIMDEVAEMIGIAVLAPKYMTGHVFEASGGGG